MKTTIWKSRAAIALTLISGLSLAACGDPEETISATEGQSTVDDPIRLGSALALTGPAAFISEEGRKGIELAIEEINEDPPLGRPLEASFQDTRSQPAEAVTAMRGFVTRDELGLLLGPVTSTEVHSVIPALSSMDALTITAMSTDPSITDLLGEGGAERIFRVNPPDDAMARTMVDLAVNELGDASLAIVARNDDLGRSAAEIFTERAEENGASITSAEFFESGGSYDFSTAIARIGRDAPDAVLFVGTLEEGIPFLRQANEQQLQARIYTRGVSITDTLATELGPDALDNIYAIEPYFSTIDSEANAAFVAAWEDSYGAEPINQGYFSYVSVHLLAKAIEAAGATDPETVAAALSDVSYEGATGLIEFDSHNQAHPNVYVGKPSCDTEGCTVEVVASASSN